LDTTGQSVHRDVIINKKSLKNIHDTKKPLNIHCNPVVTTVDKIGDLIGYGMVWYYENGIANYAMSEQCQVKVWCDLCQNNQWLFWSAQE